MLDGKTIGERLSALRGGKTREEVAVALKISAVTLYRLEKGLQRPTDKQKLALSAYYGKGIEELFFNP